MGIVLRFTRALALAGMVFAPAIHAQKMYWTDSAIDAIQRADLDGSNVEVIIASGLNFPEGIALDLAGGKIYWADGGSARIQRADLDGSNVEDVVVGVPGVPAAIALDLVDAKVYITDVATGRVMRANLDGTGLEVLLLLNGHVRGIALDLSAGKMYVTGAENTKIVRANLDGTGFEELLTGVFATQIVLDPAGGKMYWAAGPISRANLDGTNVETLTTGVAASGLSIDFGAGKMYWTELFLDKIGRANLDGSGVEDLVTSGLDTARGIAVQASAGPVAGVPSVGNSGLVALVLLLLIAAWMRIPGQIGHRFHANSDTDSRSFRTPSEGQIRSSGAG